MNEEYLKALEAAYARGMGLEQARGIAARNGIDVSLVDNFYAQKKKDPGAGISDLDLSTSTLPEVSYDFIQEQISPQEQRILQSLEAAYGRGMGMQQAVEIAQANNINTDFVTAFYKDKSKKEQSEKRGSWIIDEDPMELSRLYNVGAAQGRLGAEWFDAIASGGVPDLENLAYYNYIIKRDQPRDSDWFSANRENHPIASFLLDVVRTLPQSMITMGAATEPGLAGAATGAATGAGLTAISGPGALFGAGAGGLGGYFGGASFATEYAGALMKSFEKAGVDITSAKDLRRAFTDPEIMEQAKDYAIKRGLPIGVLDAVSAGIGGRFVKSAGKATTKALAKEAATQAALGGGGEFLGQLWSGDDISGRDIALEAFAEFGPASIGIVNSAITQANLTEGERGYHDAQSSLTGDALKSWVEVTPAAQFLRGKTTGGTTVNTPFKIGEGIEEAKAQKPADGTERKAKREKIRMLRNAKYKILQANTELLSVLPAAERQAVSKAANTIKQNLKLLKGKVTPEEQVIYEKEINEAYAEIEKAAENAREDKARIERGERPVYREQPPVESTIGTVDVDGTPTSYGTKTWTRESEYSGKGTLYQTITHMLGDLGLVNLVKDATSARPGKNERYTFDELKEKGLGELMTWGEFKERYKESQNKQTGPEGRFRSAYDESTLTDSDEVIVIQESRQEKGSPYDSSVEVVAKSKYDRRGNSRDRVSDFSVGDTVKFSMSYPEQYEFEGRTYGEEQAAPQMGDGVTETQPGKEGVEITETKEEYDSQAGERVPGPEQGGQTTGKLQYGESGPTKAPADRILQARKAAAQDPTGRGLTRSRHYTGTTADAAKNSVEAQLGPRPNNAGPAQTAWDEAYFQYFVDQATFVFESNEGGYIDLFDPVDVAVLQEWMKGLPNKLKDHIGKFVLLSQAQISFNPQSKAYVIGFGTKGKKNANKYYGGSNNAYGWTTSRTGTATQSNPSAKNPDAITFVWFPLRKQNKKSGYGYGDIDTPLSTAAHELWHNLFHGFLDRNPVDFNQFRKLIIRRLTPESVASMNEWASRYPIKSIDALSDNALSAGSYRAEEFFVELGGRLRAGQLKFEPSLLEELKAFLSNIVYKLTGERVNIFEDSRLAKDLADYMTGTTEAISAGADPTLVKIPESLRTDRFKRSMPGSVARPAMPKGGKRKNAGFLEQNPSNENLAGLPLPKPEEYERRQDAWENLITKIAERLDNLLAKLESDKYLGGVYRLRGVRQGITQAIEQSESMGIMYMIRSMKAAERIFTTVNKLSIDDRKKYLDLLDAYWRSENKADRDAAVVELDKTEVGKKILLDATILNNVRGELQGRLALSPAFDNLSKDLRETIENNAEFYTTRTYRIFTDPKNFKIDTTLQQKATNDVAEGLLLKEVEKYMDEESPNFIGEGTIAGIVSDPNLSKESVKALDGIEKLFATWLLKKSDALRRSYREALNNGGFDERGLFYAFLRETQYGQFYKEANRMLNNLIQKAKDGPRKGNVGAEELGAFRVPSKKFKQRVEMPESMQKFLGREENPVVLMLGTVQTLNDIVSDFTLVERVNDLAMNEGIQTLLMPKTIYEPLMNWNPDMGSYLDSNVLSKRRVLDIAKNLGIDTEQQYNEILFDIQSKIAQDYITITDPRSPIFGHKVHKDFASQLEQTPLYSSKWAAARWYYSVLLQMRRARVLWNTATWRKNIIGGWYFMAVNGVFGYNPERGGMTVFEDLKNRFKVMKSGEIPAELQEEFDRMAYNGLLGSSPNYALLADLNESFMRMMDGQTASESWGFDNILSKFKNKQAKLAFQYGFIDDYTKMIIYLKKRENFARRLASNPEGKKYSELTEVQKQQVDAMTAERIKQNTPTMSRINPAFRLLFRTPFGDFLSFRVESFRSYYSVLKNAQDDIREGLSNNTLSASQRNAYVYDGVMSLVAASTMAAANSYGYAILAEALFLEDEDEEQMAEEIRGIKYLLPPWMAGSNILTQEMKKDGTMRFINMSSEDPYDEIMGLVFGRQGITRSESLMAILKDFTDPNLAVRMLYNLIEGKDSYGRPILSDQDATWFNKYVVGPTLLDYDDALGTYLLKEIFLPPNLNYIVKENAKYLKEVSENSTEEMEPLNSPQLGTALLYRDYPVNIAKQFYYNMADQNFKKPYADLDEGRRRIRKQRLDEVAAAWNFGLKYAQKFENFDITKSMERTINNKLSKRERMYVMYGVSLDDIPLAE